MVAGLVPVLAKLLTDSNGDSDAVVVRHSATILTRLAGARGFPDEVQKHAVYAALVSAAVNAASYDALTEVRYVCSYVSITSQQFTGVAGHSTKPCPLCDPCTFF